MLRLLGKRPPPDGVFGYNDLVAAGALRACIEKGVRVPQDIAIVGFGNHHLTDLLLVPLTTVDQNTARIGEGAAQLMLEQLREEAPRKVLIAPKLVVRASSLRG